MLPLWPWPSAVRSLSLGSRGAHVTTSSETALRYEQVFWAAAGVLVMTGIGNLGAFGVSLLEPSTAWGTTLVAKLWLVAALIVMSLPRSLIVALLVSQTDAKHRPATGLHGYGGDVRSDSRSGDRAGKRMALRRSASTTRCSRGCWAPFIRRVFGLALLLLLYPRGSFGADAARPEHALRCRNLRDVGRRLSSRHGARSRD